MRNAYYKCDRRFGSIIYVWFGAMQVLVKVIVIPSNINIVYRSKNSKIERSHLNKNKQKRFENRHKNIGLGHIYVFALNLEGGLSQSQRIENLELCQLTDW